MAGLLPSHGGIPNVVVQPHSNYTFVNISSEHQPNSFWDWDQRNITPEGILFPVDPGNYLAYATFSSPPMKSQTISIVLSEKDDTKNAKST